MILSYYTTTISSDFHLYHVSVYFNLPPPRSTRLDQASRQLEDNPDIDHEYLPITGLPQFTKAAQGLIFGRSSKAVDEGRVISVQTLSGTGANHLAALFFAKFYEFPTSKKEIYISNPTWGTSDRRPSWF